MFGLQRYAAVVSQVFRRSTYGSHVLRMSSNAAVTAPSQTQGSTISADSTADVDAGAGAESDVNKKTKNPLIAAAFESLKEEGTGTESAESAESAPAAKKATAASGLDESISRAKTVNGLLAISESSGAMSRKQALRIVSILAEWSSMNRVKLSEFENDTRFLRICRMLGRTLPKSGNETAAAAAAAEKSSKRISGFRTDDLNTVLGVAGDDEAAKLIASISLPQMVKVMSTLAMRKRRSTPLLRSLAFNISSTSEQLDLKQCADILYAMATLNFQDSVLAAKICADIQTGLPKNSDKSAVVGSILTSLGILKYRDLDILESLTQWTLQHSDVCRPQDLSALFLTSAILNFKSANIEDVRNNLLKVIVQEDFSKSIDWLNHVWALAMLGLADNQLLETVLNTAFVQKLESDKGLTTTAKMKLLNVNSFAKLLAADYRGPLLPNESAVFDLLMAHGKSKQMLVNGMLDALKSLLPASNHVRSLVDSNMGFLIDAICVFDAKRNPLPLDKEQDDAIRVALMVVDFHDVCHGTHRAATGITALSFDLLEKSGYRVIPVPYNEFNTSDKLLKRVQYLEAKFKRLISNK